MTTFIKAKLKCSFIYYIISYCLEIKLPRNHNFKIHDDKSFFSCRNVCKKCLFKMDVRTLRGYPLHSDVRTDRP